MASRYFKAHRQQFAKQSLLLHHGRQMAEHYDFLRFRINDNVLICTGKINSADYRNEYTIEVRCVAGHEPHSKILEPTSIVPCSDIHMYDDHSLCLHYPPDMKWSGWTPIYQYTIPWIIEWIHYYEIYLINGNVWEGPESPEHFTENDKNVQEDIEEE